MILTNAVLAKSACQSLIQFADRLFSAIYIIEDCHAYKKSQDYLQSIANNPGFLFEEEFSLGLTFYVQYISLWNAYFLILIKNIFCIRFDISNFVIIYFMQII